MKLPRFLAQMPANQRRIGRMLVGFFALMAAFTLLSRGLDSYSVAQVSVTMPSHGTISHRVTLDGSTKALWETAVAMPEGFLVQQMLVREGSRVAAGDVLAVLDTASIERQLADARRSLQDAQLAAAMKAVQAEKPEKDPYEEAELALERAKEDAVTSEKAAADAIARVESDLREAQQERRRLRDEGAEDAELEANRKEIFGFGFDLEDAIREAEEAQVKAARAIEDAERAIEEAAHAQAEKESEVLAQQKTQGLESARDGLSIGEWSARVAELEALLAAEGKIVAERDGIVTGQSVQTGDVTTVGGALLLAGQGAGSVFEGAASKKDAERLAVGDKVEISFPGVQEPYTATITAIATPEEKGGTYTIRAEMPDADLRPGVAGTLEIIKSSAESTTLLPLSALHSDGGERAGYVYVLRTRNTTMGEQTVVERLAVEVLDRGEKTAAVTGAFTPDDLVVEASSRALTPGDRVRLGGEKETQ